MIFRAAVLAAGLLAFTACSNSPRSANVNDGGSSATQASSTAGPSAASSTAGPSASSTATNHADPNDDPVLCPNHGCVVPPEGGQGEAAQRAQEGDKPIVVKASNASAFVNGKDVPITAPVTCTWNPEHTGADAEEKPIASVDPRTNEDGEHYAMRDNTKGAWEVTFWAKPDEPVEVTTVTFLNTPDWNWSATYVDFSNRYENQNALFPMSKNDASATRTGNHYTFTGKVMATGREYGAVPPPNPPQYGTFKIEFSC